MDLGWGGLLQHTDQQINALLHHRSRLQMAAPHLAGPIGEAEVKVHTTRADGAIEGDHLQVPLQHGGFRLARALKCSPGEIADHSEHKTVDSVLTSQFFQAQTQITAGIKLQRQ